MNVLSTNAHDKRDERAENIVTQFKKIMDMLNDEANQFRTDRRDVLKNIGSQNATLSYSLVEITGDALALAVDSPYFALLDRCSDMINLYYHVQNSRRVNDKLKIRMLDNIVLNLRKALHYIAKDQRREEQSERKKFRATALGLAGDVGRVSRQLNRPISKRIAKEEGDKDYDDEENDEANDEDEDL